MARNQYDLPPDTNAGLDFNYSSWGANSSVKFCNVPWNSDYRDVVKFESEAKLADYIYGLPGPNLTGLSYQRYGHPVRVDRRFSEMQNYNYIRVFNAAQPGRHDIPQAFYYFITSVEYIAAETTQITIQLDAWSTFIHGVRFGNCYIERGHVGVANMLQFKDYGREYLTHPEGLDVGGEYRVMMQTKRRIAGARGEEDASGTTEHDYGILMVTTTALEETGGTVEEPEFKSATGSNMQNLPNGAEIYYFKSGWQLKNWLKENTEKPWVTQGIISLTAVPGARYGIPLESSPIQGNYAPHRVKGGSLETKREAMNTRWRETFENRLKSASGSMGKGRYRHLKKFLTYPYTIIELTGYNGTPLIIKPESWNDPDATVIEVPHFAPPAPRIMFYPFRYNADSFDENDNEFGTGVQKDDYGIVNDGGEFIDFSTGIFNFPMFSVVNNGYMGYLASNQSGISFQHQSADWAQSRALQGNQVGYDQASGAIGNTVNQANIGLNAARQSTALGNEMAGFGAIKSAANSIIGGIGNRDFGTAIMGGANAAADYAMQTHQNNASLAINTNATVAGTNSNTAQAGMVRDTNKAFADMAANGDYQNQIAGINAKVQDAKMIQPTISGQVGGDAFLFANYKWGMDLKIKMLQPAAMRSIGEFWLRYGYLCNTFGVPRESLMVMSKFTYWKLKETYIISSQCPETIKQTLRGIMEKGVTIWANPNDIGNIDIADNEPLAGVTL